MSNNLLKAKISNGGDGNYVRKISSTSSVNARANWLKVFAAGKFLSLANFKSHQAPAHMVVGGKYYVGHKIANGAFGQLRIGHHIDCKDQQVAIKTEDENSICPLLYLEYKFYKTIGNEIGFPKVYHYGKCDKYNSLVMELLDSNLEELFNKQNRFFSTKTIIMIAIQLITRLETLHSHRIISRDIKPENCLIGRKENCNLIYIVDLGLGKEFMDSKGRHIPLKDIQKLTGTVRYMSINAHYGYEQSRRDDLEALGHMLFYFLSKGMLPWQGIRISDNKRKYNIVCAVKEKTNISTLGYKHPKVFSEYLEYCRGLEFSQTPDYEYLKDIFRKSLKSLNLIEDNIFDWMQSSNENSDSISKNSDKITNINNNESTRKKYTTLRNKSDESVCNGSFNQQISSERFKDNEKSTPIKRPIVNNNLSNQRNEYSNHMMSLMIEHRNGYKKEKPSKKIIRNNSPAEIVRFNSCSRMRIFGKH